MARAWHRAGGMRPASSAFRVHRLGRVSLQKTARRSIGYAMSATSAQIVEEIKVE